MKTKRPRPTRPVIRLRFWYNGRVRSFTCLLENAEMITRHLYRDGAVRVRIG